MITTFTILFTLLVIWFLTQPLLFSTKRNRDHQALSSSTALIDQRERYLQSLRDLELDYNTQKITTEEYTELKNSLTMQLAAVLKEIDAHAG